MNKLYAELDRLRTENESLLKKLERSNDAWINERAENIKCKDERDGYRNGQAQLQKICDDLQDVIRDYAGERKMLMAELSLLKAPIENWEENVMKGIG